MSAYTEQESERIKRWLRACVWAAFGLGWVVGLVSGLFVRFVMVGYPDGF